MQITQGRLRLDDQRDAVRCGDQDVGFEGHGYRFTLTLAVLLNISPFVGEGDGHYADPATFQTGGRAQRSLCRQTE